MSHTWSNRPRILGVKILGPKIQGPKVLELRVPSVHLNISKLLKTVRLMKKHFTCTAWASISTACQSFWLPLRESSDIWPLLFVRSSHHYFLPQLVNHRRHLGTFWQVSCGGLLSFQLLLRAHLPQHSEGASGGVCIVVRGVLAKRLLRLRRGRTGYPQEKRNWSRRAQKVRLGSWDRWGPIPNFRLGSFPGHGFPRYCGDYQ